MLRLVPEPQRRSATSKWNCKFWDLLRQPDPVPWLALGVGLLVSAVSAWLCIKLFLQTIQRIGMLPFVLYRLVLAAVIVLAFR